MVIIDFSVHIHTVHVYVQMRYATFRIMMECDHILAVLYVGGLSTGAFCLFREVDRIEYLDVLVCQPYPISQRPACGFFLSWGYFHSYHILQPADSSLVGDISILITFRLSGLPLLIVLENSFCLSTMR